MIVEKKRNITLNLFFENSLSSSVRQEWCSNRYLFAYKFRIAFNRFRKRGGGAPFDISYMDEKH